MAGKLPNPGPVRSSAARRKRQSWTAAICGQLESKAGSIIRSLYRPRDRGWSDSARVEVTSRTMVQSSERLIEVGRFSVSKGARPDKEKCCDAACGSSGCDIAPPHTPRGAPRSVLAALARACRAGASRVSEDTHWRRLAGEEVCAGVHSTPGAISGCYSLEDAVKPKP